MSFFDDAFEKAKEKNQVQNIVPEQKKTELMPSISSIENELKIMAKQSLEILAGNAEEFKITDEATLDQSAEMILQSNKINNTIEACRKKFVRPYLDAQQAINAFAKEYTSVCKSIKDGLSAKRAKYQQEQREIEMKKQKEEAINELEKKCTHLPIPTVHEKFTSPEAPKKFADGRVDTKIVLDFEIEDFEKVPRKFLTLDDAAVKRSLDAGVRSIPGLIIKEKIKEVFKTGRR